MLPLVPAALVLGGLYVLGVPDRLEPRVPLWWQLALAGAVCLVPGLLRRSLRYLAFLGVGLLAAAPTPYLTRSTELVTKSAEDHFLAGGLGPAVEKFARSVTYELRHSWLFEENGGGWLSWVYAAGLLIGLAFALRRVLRADPLAVFAVLYPLTWCVAHAVSDFEFNFRVTQDGMGSRYMMPLLPCFVAWVAMAVQDLWPRLPRLGVAVAAAPAAAGLLGVLSLLDPARAFAQPPVRGTEFPFFHGHVEAAAGDDLGERLAWIERVDPDWAAFRPMCYQNVQLPPLQKPDVERYYRDIARAAASPPELRPYLLVSLGYQAALARRLAPLLEEIAARLSGEELDWFLRGAGKGWLFTTVDERMRFEKAEVRRMLETGLEYGEIRPRLPGLQADAPAYLLERLRELPPRLARPAAQGAGFELGYRVTPYQPSLFYLLPLGDQLDEPLRAPFYHALGLGYRIRFHEDRWFVPAEGALRIEAFLPESGRTLFREGLALPGDRFETP